MTQTDRSDVDDNKHAVDHKVLEFVERQIVNLLDQRPLNCITQEQEDENALTVKCVSQHNLDAWVYRAILPSLEQNCRKGAAVACPLTGRLEAAELVGMECRQDPSCSASGPNSGGRESYRLDSPASG